jgi:hypothetical protein
MASASWPGLTTMRSLAPCWNLALVDHAYALGARGQELARHIEEIPSRVEYRLATDARQPAWPTRGAEDKENPVGCRCLPGLGWPEASNTDRVLFMSCPPDGSCPIHRTLKLSFLYGARLGGGVAIQLWH